MKHNPSKPVEVTPAMQPMLIILCLCCIPLVILGLLGKAPGLAALGIILGLGFIAAALPFMYPRILVSEEGLHIQRKSKAPLKTLPWRQFQCVYTFRQGMTYKACGLLFTAKPLSKQEQLDAAKACQAGGFRPRLIYEGNVWVGTSLAALQSLDSMIPAHIHQMPETACANVNLRFTKLI